MNNKDLKTKIERVVDAIEIETHYESEFGITSSKIANRSEISKMIEELLNCVIEDKQERRRYFWVTYAINNGIGSVHIDCIGMFNADGLTAHLKEKKGIDSLVITGYQEMSEDDYLTCSKKQ